jgi:hypothetical protein
MRIRSYNIYDMMLRGPADKPGAGDDDLNPDDLDDGGEGDGEQTEEAHEEDDEGREGRQKNAGGEEPDEEDDEAADVLDSEGDAEDDEPGLAAKAERKPGKKTITDKFLAERAERRAEKERADRIERELQELRAERQKEKATADAATEADRLALMTTEERVEYTLNKKLEELTRHSNMMAFKTADDADKASFEQRAKTDPRIAKRLERVETELMNARKAGMNFKREVILAQVLGQDMLRRMNEPQKKPAAKPNALRGKPPANGRGDQASARRQTTSLEKRLANVAL